MGVLKPIIKSIDNSSGLRKVNPKRAGELLNTAPKGNLGFIDDMAEYDKIAGDLERASQAPITHKEIQAEIAIKRAQEAENERLKRISPDFKDADFDAQARTPEEYASRVEQLVDPGVSVRAREKGAFEANIENPFETGMEAQERYRRWLSDQDSVRRVVSTNQSLMDWGKQGAYTRGRVFGDVDGPDDPVIFYRMDIRQDPREGLSPIQFDADANEFGMHIGSKAAGQGIVSPEVSRTNKRRMEQLKNMFDELAIPLADEGIDPLEVFGQAMSEVRHNLFLRYGEKPFDTPSLDVVNEVIDDFFDELKFIGTERNIEGFRDIPSEEAMKIRLRSIMRTHYDPHQHPVMTDVKQGLFVQDLGPNNTASGIAQNLQGRGIFDDDELQAVVNAGENARQNVLLRDMLRQKGYDHLVYVNEAEDAGAISIVLFDEANYQNLLKPTIGRKGQPTGHQAASAAILAPIMGAIKHIDFSIVWGHRDMEAQNLAYSTGSSRNRWPTSKHNVYPANAFDIVPYPAMYGATYKQFFEMATYVFAAASKLGVPIRWGGHWKNYTGRGFYDRDWAHFEKIT
jgi:hypothetical protein